MSEPIRLEPIEAHIVRGNLAIPHGMKPIYLQNLDGKMIAHVEGWTAEREYDHNYFDLYPMGQARRFIVRLTVNGEKSDREWYDGFGEPTKEAMKSNGEWTVRERATAVG